MSKDQEISKALQESSFQADMYWDKENRCLVFRDPMDPYHDFCVSEDDLESLASLLAALTKALRN